MIRYLAFVFAFGSLGCSVGGNVNKLAVAHQPTGAMASIQPTTGPRFNAEVLAVRDTAVVVLHSGRVTLVPYRLIEQASFRDVFVTIENGRTPSAANRDELRLVSRFPQGLSPDLEAKLLAAHGQASVVVLAQ